MVFSHNVWRAVHLEQVAHLQAELKRANTGEEVQRLTAQIARHRSDAHALSIEEQREAFFITS
jgi:hypothetical protein